MREIRAIILAAGKGTRMKSDVPKVLHKVCGRPMLHYVLDVARAVGSRKTYLVVGHKSEAVCQYVGEQCTTVEQKQLLGTADAVKQVAGRLQGYSGDVLLLCGDTPLLSKETIKGLIRQHHRKNAVCSVLTAVVHDPSGYGRIIRDTHGGVVAIREDKDATGCERDIEEINTGVYCFTAAALFSALRDIKLNAKKKEFYLTDVIELFVKKGLSVVGVETEDPEEGLGINTREDLALAENIMRHQINRRFMADGVTIEDPATTYIDPSVKIGTDTVIRPCTVIEQNVRIGSRCIIGPFARIRGGSVIGTAVEIGNFAEVNVSRVGDRCFMKHFSYLGNAIVGKGANIGAGTVTANFDGKNKNTTKIGDGAFIGCDSILVAPVVIGKKAVTGAGCVVTRGTKVADHGVVVGIPARPLAKRGRA